MFRFAHPHFLYALLLLPVCIYLFYNVLQWRKKSLQRMGTYSVVKRLIADASGYKFGIRFVLTMFAFILLILALSGPQLGTHLSEVKRKGADVIIALDVSNSMKAEDLSPNRLERAKESIARLIDRLEGDRIGIVVFAGQAFVQLPITTDYAAAKMFLGTIDTDISPTQGTAIGAAIRLSVESFGNDLGRNKALIIITDGENHEDDAVKATQEAVEKGIMVSTIGMGSPNGSPIPIVRNGIKLGFKKDGNGNTVITKLNEQALQEIATTGNGIYVHATNYETGLNLIIDQVNKLEKRSFETKQYRDYDDKFMWLLTPCVFLLLVELLMNERKSIWWSKLNLFGENQKK